VSVPSYGLDRQTIDFLQAARRDTAAAKRFFEKVFSSSSNPIPRVINVDKNSAEPSREYRNDEHDPQGRVRRVTKGDVVAEARFTLDLFDITA
jgi:transposase-like protein